MALEEKHRRSVHIPETAVVRVPADVVALARLVEETVGELRWNLGFDDREKPGEGVPALEAALSGLAAEGAAPELVTLTGSRDPEAGFGSVWVHLGIFHRVEIEGTDLNWVAGTHVRFDQLIRRHLPSRGSDRLPWWRQRALALAASGAFVISGALLTVLEAFLPPRTTTIQMLIGPTILLTVFVALYDALKPDLAEQMFGRGVRFEFEGAQDERRRWQWRQALYDIAQVAAVLAFLIAAAALWVALRALAGGR